MSNSEIKKLKAEANRGDLDAMLDLAIAYEDQQNYKEAMKWYKKAKAAEAEQKQAGE